MNMAYLLSVPSFTGNAPWTTGQGVGSAVAAFLLGPTRFTNSTNVTAVAINYTVNYQPPFGYFANIFQLYRGSFTMTMKVVKTEFHSGRLQVSFYPGKNLSIGAGSLPNSQYVFREIVDLRDSSEVTITFPYTSLVPYMNVNDAYGLVDVRVVNPLVAPENLSTSCDVLFEWSGAPDFEFAVPIPAREAPIIFTPQSGGMSSGSGSMSTSGQGLGHVVDNATISPDLQPALYCIGERLRSVRQLTKRFTTSWAASTMNDPVMVIDPQLHYIPTLSVSAGPVVIADMKTDLVSYFSSLFRYTRGAMRHKIIDPGNSGSCLTAQIRVATGTQGNSVFFGAVQPKGCCDQPLIFLPSLTGGAEIEMPYYNATHASGTRYVSGVGQNQSRSVYDNPLLLQVTQGAMYSTSARVFRAAGDDHSFGFFIGTLPTCASAVFNPTSA